MEYCDVIFRKILLNHHVVMNDVILTSINTEETGVGEWGEVGRREENDGGNLGKEIWGWILGKDKTFSWGGVAMICCFDTVDE